LARIMTIAVGLVCAVTAFGEIFATTYFRAATASLVLSSLALITFKKIRGDRRSGTWPKSWYLFTTVLVMVPVSDLVFEQKVISGTLELVIPFLIALYIIRDFGNAEQKYLLEVAEKQEASKQRDI